MRKMLAVVLALMLGLAALAPAALAQDDGDGEPVDTENQAYIRFANWRADGVGADFYFDGELSDTGLITIDVQPVNDNPVLPALTDVTWLARATSSLILPEATDVEDDSLTYTVTLENGDPLPAWLNFDAATLTLSGTPAQENVGIYQIKVRVEDNNSGSVEGVFTPTVESNLLQVFLPIISR